MILSIYITGHLIKLTKVDSEEEAFYEMQRYMSVNNIYSDVTTISRGEFTDGLGQTEIIKYVSMCPYSSLNDRYLMFAIHCSTQPEYNSLEDAVSKSKYFAYCFERYNQKKSSYESNSLRFWRYKSENISDSFDSWFPDEYNRYIKDLIKRGGETLCH